MNLIDRALLYPERTAIISNSKSFTYQDLLNFSGALANQLLDGKTDLAETRVAFMINPGFSYVKTQWAIWRAGGIAVPLHPGSPADAVQYILEDTTAEVLVMDNEYLSEIESYAQANGIRLIPHNAYSNENITLPDIDPNRRAMILYTSGTTGAPKGVVTTHANIEAQITSLVEAWEWRREDHILNILPMHHVHGIINVLSCALWVGATCEFLPKFDVKAVLDVLTRGDVTLFMAVPTIYHKLIAYWETLPEEEKSEIHKNLFKLRLMVSGSAALPVSVMEKWKEISGHTLLERYGMTEIGMAISNPYNGERRPGHIGQPLPGVVIMLADDKLEQVSEGEQGQILVKGNAVFLEYWGRPTETSEAFTTNHWFKTGDIAIYDTDSYKIIGRSSVDIIKSGGYKISALEIEEILRQRPEIKDCGVVGVADDEWGERVCAAIVLRNVESELSGNEIDLWIRTKLPAYKIPRKYIFLKDLPRNAMGKVTKKELKQFFTNHM